MSEDEIILTHILQCSALDLIINRPVLTAAQQKQFDVYKRRRQNNEPLQYILGCCNFMGLALTVNPSVLVPRPETEQLVEVAIRRVRSLRRPISPHGTHPPVGLPDICHDPLPLRAGAAFAPPAVLDLGTGSGCIAITLAKHLPQARVVAVDISSDALAVARENAQRHGVDDRIQFVQADIGSSAILNEAIGPMKDFQGRFDLIISNPPYIPTSQIFQLPEDVRQEPVLALDGGADGLDFYRAIIKYTPRLLSGGGCLMMEFGDGQAGPIQALFGQAFGLEIFKDLAGKERFLMARRERGS